MINALSIDVEDWFQVENLRAVYPQDSWNAQELRVEIGTHRVLDALAAENATATFFILGWIAERLPGLVSEIAKAGHEIACHGYNHDLVYDLGPDGFRDDIRRAKALLEDISGCVVHGYRAPNFSITEKSLWAPQILSEEGFAYDSSVFPTSVHDRYGLQDFGIDPFEWDCGLREIPLAVRPVGNTCLPVAGGGYFRLFPYLLTRKALRDINRTGRAFTFYLHPWELDHEQPRINSIPLSFRFRHYVNLHTTEGKLRRLAGDFRFSSIRNVYEILH